MILKTCASDWCELVLSTQNFEHYFLKFHQNLFFSHQMDGTLLSSTFLTSCQKSTNMSQKEKYC